MPRAMVWMDQMREKFGAIDNARAGPTEISCIDHEDASVLDGGNLVEAELIREPRGALHRLLTIIAARHENDDIGLSFEHLVPCEANRVFPFASEDIDAAS